jgi:YHS domain-containing protein
MITTLHQGFVFVVLSLLLLLILGVGSSVVAGSDSAVPAVNTGNGVGLKGYDPVAYFVSGQPIKGNRQHSTVWKGVTYRFASAENLDRFKTAPQNYLPQYGGYCAYAMSLNRIADVDPSRWAIVDGKLYLNNGYVAQSLWLLNKSSNIESADRNWPIYPKLQEGK